MTRFARGGKCGDLAISDPSVAASVRDHAPIVLKHLRQSQGTKSQCGSREQASAIQRRRVPDVSVAEVRWHCAMKERFAWQVS